MEGEGLECDVCIEHVSECKYLGCVFDESGTDEEVVCIRMVASGRRVVGANSSLVNDG